MFGYVRPCKDELLVREYAQYKAVYCQLCKTLDREYGWLSKFSLSYDCAFYALLAMSVHGARVRECQGRCRANPLKKCRYLEAEGDELDRAAALQVLLTWHKLRDDAADEGFLKGLGARLLLPYVGRKAKKAEARCPDLARLAREAVEAQARAEAEQAGPDACAEPTARLLAGLFAQLREDDPGQAAALEQFGYYLGRWVYLMDAADDLAGDLAAGKFNPFVRRLGLEGKTALSPEEREAADRACNEALNATVARLLPPLNLIDLEGFGPIVENVAAKGLAELQREILFLHVKEKKTLMREP